MDTASESTPFDRDLDESLEYAVVMSLDMATTSSQVGLVSCFKVQIPASALSWVLTGVSQRVLLNCRLSQWRNPHSE